MTAHFLWMMVGVVGLVMAGVCLVMAIICLACRETKMAGGMIVCFAALIAMYVLAAILDAGAPL